MPLIATRTAMAPPSSGSEEDARPGPAGRHRRKRGGRCGALLRLSAPQQNGGSDEPAESPAAIPAMTSRSRVVWSSDCAGWEFEPDSLLRCETLHSSSRGRRDRRAAGSGRRQLVDHALPARQLLSAARHAVAVRHHDQQRALCTGRRAPARGSARTSRASATATGRRRGRSGFTISATFSVTPLLLRLADDRVQLLGLILRDLRVEGNERVLREQEIAGRVAVGARA